MYNEKSKTVKVKCPGCGKPSYQWDAEATDSNGSVMFRKGEIDDDIFITEFRIICPYCHESFVMGREGLLLFMEENKEVD